MSYTIKLLPEARLDIRDSIDWYNEQKPGLGKLFYQAVKSRLTYIKENPLHYQVSFRNIRSALVEIFHIKYIIALKSLLNRLSFLQCHIPVETPNVGKTAPKTR